MLLETKKLEKLKFFTIVIIVLVLWFWEIFEHFLLLPTEFILFIEMLPLTAILVVLLYFLFGTIIKACQRLEKSNRDLNRLQSYQASILDSSPNAIITVDQTGLISSFNRHAETISDYSAREAIRTNIFKIFKDGNQIRQMLDRAYSHKGVETIKETAMLTKFGVEIPVSVRLRRIKGNDDTGGGVVMIVEDLRERKRFEQRLVISEKMAAASQLSAGLAHEIKNPLASIGVNLRNLEDQFKGDTRVIKKHKKYFSMISSEVERLNYLVNSFVSSAIPQKIESKDCFCPIDEIVHGALENCQQFLKEISIHVVENFQKRSLCVGCDREQLTRAFSNLIKNAVEAMPSAGELTLEIQQEGDWIRVKVCDTGCGIPRENLKHIFDFYFTTKTGGLGIGLPFALWVIEQHGGRIEIESETNKGTCVQIWLPIIKADSIG